jgi:hypothetical protein
MLIVSWIFELPKLPANIQLIHSPSTAAKSSFKDSRPVHQPIKEINAFLQNAVSSLFSPFKIVLKPPESGVTSKKPRWIKACIVHAIVVVLLLSLDVDPIEKPIFFSKTRGFGSRNRSSSRNGSSLPLSALGRCACSFLDDASDNWTSRGFLSRTTTAAATIAFAATAAFLADGCFFFFFFVVGFAGSRFGSL